MDDRPAAFRTPMETDSDRKDKASSGSASLGGVVRSIPGSQTDFKAPVAIFAAAPVGMATDQQKARMLALQKYNAQLAENVAQLQNEKKATTVDCLAEAIGKFSYYHVLPFIGEDECLYPILVNRELDQVWSLQTQVPEYFAKQLPNLLWEQLWQMRWMQATQYGQCLCVRYCGGTESRDSLSECDSFLEAVTYSQELLLVKTEKLMPTNLHLNPRRSCVYMDGDEVVLVFRDASVLKAGAPNFFCVTLRRLLEHVKKLEKEYKQGYTSGAMTSYAKVASPAEFKDDKLMHRHIVAAIVLEVTARFKTFKQATTSYVLKSAADQLDPFEVSMNELLEPPACHSWEMATEKLLLKLVSKRFALKNPTMCTLVDAIVRFWFCSLVQFVVPAKVYQWCMRAYKNFGGLETAQETCFARWTSAICNALAVCEFQKTKASPFYNPNLFAWAPDAYVQLPPFKRLWDSK